ncbi:aryl-alcohol dehydrogenase-like predicted oxidoreductase [Paenibacillus sp. DS2015]|uniref:aldo/keto reductase n=1 Tax=Paenibacillus sp. DS2015 TaxID=3373917 RepID=UPI003D22637C
MKYRKLGRTGLKVSEVSLGTMAFGRWIDEAQSANILDLALDKGINLVDTADVYGKGMDTGKLSQLGESEEVLGNILKAKRNQVLLATKFNSSMGSGMNDGGQSRYHIYRALESSLKRLQTDYIDLYQVHRFSPDTPIEETLRALDDLIKQGKIRYIGCSNYAAWQIAKAHGISALHNLNRFETIQPEYSLITRGIEQEILPFAQSEGVGVIVYSPLGRGILSGKYREGIAAPVDSRLAHGEERLKVLLNQSNALALVNVLQPLADRRGLTLPQFALSWVLSKPGISSAIIGASKPEHIRDTLDKVNEYLTIEELKEIDHITEQF